MCSQQRLDWQGCAAIETREYLFSWSSASVSGDFSEYQRGLLPNYSTFLELNILLVVTRNCSKLWKNCPRHSQLMLQVGLISLETVFSCFVEIPLLWLFIHWHLSVVAPPVGPREGNLKVWAFYARNPFPLIYLLFP